MSIRNPLEESSFEFAKGEWARRHESPTEYGQAVLLWMVFPIIWIMDHVLVAMGHIGEKIEKAIKSEPEEEEMVELEVDMEDELIEKINIEANKLGITFDEFVQMAIRECLRNETKGKV